MMRLDIRTVPTPYRLLFRACHDSQLSTSPRARHSAGWRSEDVVVDRCVNPSPVCLLDRPDSSLATQRVQRFGNGPVRNRLPLDYTTATGRDRASTATSLIPKPARTVPKPCVWMRASQLLYVRALPSESRHCSPAPALCPFPSSEIPTFLHRASRSHGTLLS